MSIPSLRRPRRWSLRTRLLLSIVALFAAASLVVGIVSVVALRGFLMDRLDQQLAAATGRSQSAVGGESGDAPVPTLPPGPTEFSDFRAGVQGPLTVTAVVVGPRVLAVVVNPEGNLEQLTGEQAGTLAGVDPTGEPVTVNLGGDLGSYRVAANQVIFGSSGTLATVVTGLPMSDVQDVLLQLGLVIGAVTIIALGSAVAAGALVVRHALRPLERLAATASRVAELPLERGEVALSVRVPEGDADPSTEVGQVGVAINRMLGHVASALEARQASENKVRQFVADASHELRTPLASIRGYAELTRMRDHQLPEEVVHAIGRVESEAKRMTSLVEDLLLLARLDAGRDLEKKPFDITQLLVNAVGDAHAAGPEHEWSLEQPDGPVMIDGDAIRLQQAVSNLLTNARVHTPPGTAVKVSLSTDPHRVAITVADNGPGFPEGLTSELFERFARGDGSRSRAAGSTGLGLAIVKAIASGHGGTVTAASEPGRTVFELSLPR